MKIGFVYSENYEKYDELLEDIIKKLKDRINDKQVVIESILNKTSRKKYDLYVILSDDVEDFDASVNKLKCNSNVILITSNLSEEYITYTISKVMDIIYSKNKPEIVLNRLEKIIGKMYA